MRRWQRAAPLLALFLLGLQKASAGPVMECKKVGAEELVDEQGCELLIVRVNRCSGYCFSISFPNPLTGQMNTHMSKCCRMTDTEWVYANMACTDGIRQIKIPSALQCDCFDCAVN